MSNGWNFSSAGLSAAGSIAGGIMSAKQAKKWRKLQKDIAQKQIRWRVEDAKAAGIHPLAAVGISPSSGTGFVSAGDYGVGDALDSMGQAMRAQGAMTPEEKRIMRAKADQEETKTKILGIELSNLRLAKNAPVVNTDDATVSSETGIVLPGQDQAQMQMTGGYEGGIYGTGPMTGTMLELARQTVKKGPGLEAGMPAGEKFVQIGEWYWPELTQNYTELLEDNLPFKLRYYDYRLSKAFEGLVKHYGGARAMRMWKAAWNKILGDPGKDYFWEFNPRKGFRKQHVSKYKRRSRSFRWAGEKRGKEPDWKSLTW